ncbi:TraR/DksA family transcriptional regulator [uncultured Brachyspira sp.]|uniref:TraR/DksA family transcriptional regulator n=1 Tax=uncultured Brachyspira sp. TaxID=221953 RepID=UPI002621DFBB|nr:TraR/DksA family transcriptional regulator [uncultured Brachyspira sp.]
MNAKKLKKFKDLILEEKRKTLDELLSGNESYETLKEDAHGDLADMAFQAYEKQSLVSFSQKERDRLDMLNNALKRIEDGTYGKCIDCKEEINEERLTAIPYTLRCINCMSKYEDKKRREKM